MEKAVVYLQDMKSHTVKTHLSKKDGSFQFTGLSYDVDYQVYAEYRGARSDTGFVSSLTDNNKVVNITLRVK